MKPQTETIIKYISSGMPGYMEGELYIESPDQLRRIFEYIDPRPAPRKYCILKPLDLFASTEEPELVSFFARPEVLCGLHQLAAFVTSDPEVVASPWGAACTNLIGWPVVQKKIERSKYGNLETWSLAVPFEIGSLDFLGDQFPQASRGSDPSEILLDTSPLSLLLPARADESQNSRRYG